MQLYFIRHGQSTNNRLYDQTQSSRGRSEDAELTDLGLRQAECVASFLAQPNGASSPRQNDPHNAGGFHLTHLYCSLMTRAAHTGDFIARATGLPLTAWPDLHEEGGIFVEDEAGDRLGLPGKKRSDFERLFPGLILPDSLGEQGWWNRPFETEAERPLRARRVWQALQSRHAAAEHRVAVVSHGGFYNHFLSAVLGLPDAGETSSRFFRLNNTAISRFDIWPERVEIMYLNRVDFLPAEWIS